MRIEGRPFRESLIELDDLHTGHYRMRVHADDHVSADLEFDVRFGEVRIEREVRLSRATSLWVVEAELGAPGTRAGLQVGDCILAWGEHRVHSIGALERARSQLGGVVATIRLQRGGQGLTLPVSTAVELELGLENRR